MNCVVYLMTQEGCVRDQALPKLVSNACRLPASVGASECAKRIALSPSVTSKTLVSKIVSQLPPDCALLSDCASQIGCVGVPALFDKLLVLTLWNATFGW